MAKKSTIFFCQNCGYESAKWLGQCPACKEWNTLVEETVVTGKAGKSSKKAESLAARIHEAQPVKLSGIKTESEIRTATGFEELDRVLGGGIVAGSLVLVGGDPGIGKSTILLQVCKNLTEKGKKVLYISGEESLQQIKLRASRIGSFGEEMLLLCETSLETIQGVIERVQPEIVVIDSIQTMYQEDVSSAPGSVSQVREATSVFMQIAKRMGISIFIVGHVTKEGVVAGPRVLEHMVDTVLYFEGEAHMSYRILRAAKNRFGATNEIGVFEMRSEGLVEVPNPSEMLLSGRPDDAPGTCVTCVMEGQRPVLAEVQALLAPAAQSVSRRTSNGFDYNRAAMLMAVLEKRGALKVSSCDAFLNVIGGLSVDEPAADLAAVLALASSYLDKPIGNHVAAIGEVGLTGELRSVNHLSERLSEVHRLGFETCIIPKQRKDQIRAPQGLALIEACNIAEALRAIVQA